MDVRAARFLPLLGSIACAGATGATLEGGVVHVTGATFHVGDVPSSWHRVNIDDAALSFRDEHGSSVLVAARCNIRADDIPLVALTNQLVLGTTDREFVKEETISLDHREARHSVMKAKLDGVALVWDVYVMKKNGCVYDVVYVAPPNRFEGGSSAFEQFAVGLRTISEGGGS